MARTWCRAGREDRARAEHGDEWKREQQAPTGEISTAKPSSQTSRALAGSLPKPNPLHDVSRSIDVQLHRICRGVDNGEEQIVALIEQADRRESERPHPRSTSACGRASGDWE